MKTVLSLGIVGCLFAFHRPVSSLNANEVLQRALAKLTALRTVRYQYYRDVNYRSESYRNELSGSTYLDFGQTKNPIGFWFQTDGDASKLIYNGETLLLMSKADKTMHVEKNPAPDRFASMSFFYNSLVTLRNSIKIITSDGQIPKTLTDTTVRGKPCHAVRFSLHSQTLKNLGGLSKLTTDRLITYTVVIDKQTYLPALVLQTNSVTPQDYVLTRFSDYNLTDDKPAETSWHYLTYASEYKPIFAK